VTGKTAAFTRVELEPGRPAFIATSDLKTGGNPKPILQTLWQVTPPVLTASAPTVVNGSTVHVKGQATDDHQVKDVYIRVINRDSKIQAKKVFYLPNRGDRTKLPFETDVPLWPGSNFIQVFARETNEVQTLATLVVLQKQPPSLVDLRGSNPPAAPDKGAAGRVPENHPGAASVGR
jgi:hypothetical protein